MESLIQHFAAGVVFSVVSVELLPDFLKEESLWIVAVGFAGLWLEYATLAWNVVGVVVLWQLTGFAAHTAVATALRARERRALRLIGGATSLRLSSSASH